MLDRPSGGEKRGRREREIKVGGDGHGDRKARPEVPYRVGPGVGLGQPQVAFGEGGSCGEKSRAWAERSGLKVVSTGRVRLTNRLSEDSDRSIEIRDGSRRLHPEPPADETASQKGDA